MKSIPPSSGISLKAQHYQELIDNPGTTGWLELHPENYMGLGGPPHRYLKAISEIYPISMHGVGMSLGSTDGVNEVHLERLKSLIDRYQPAHVSEHLSWSHWNSTYLNDLLPLPYTHESLDVICNNIDKVQSRLERQILIENPSAYIDFKKSDFSEGDFFKAIISRCDCRILLDINNVYVSAFNNKFDPYEYINSFPCDHVSEIHLAGHSIKTLTNDTTIRIDDHGSEVRPEVWKLYEYFFTQQDRAVPTLIEWDTDVPELGTLLNEAKKSDVRMRQGLNNAAKDCAR